MLILTQLLIWISVANLTKKKDHKEQPQNKAKEWITELTTANSTILLSKVTLDAIRGTKTRKDETKILLMKYWRILNYFMGELKLLD